MKMIKSSYVTPQMEVIEALPESYIAAASFNAVGSEGYVIGDQIDL